MMLSLETYKCNNCNYEVQKLIRKMHDLDQICPQCLQPMRRKYHPVNVVYKARGFYTTDKRREEQWKEVNAND